MYSVGVHNFSCVLVFKKLDTLKSKIPWPLELGTVNTNLGKQLKRGNFEIASNIRIGFA
jgi:hypothetical protein